jgi:hypothetical protein
MDDQSLSQPLFGGSNTPSNTETLFLKYQPHTQATKTTFNFILAFVAKKLGLRQQAIQNATDILSEYLTDEEFKDIENLIDFQKKEEINDIRLEQETIYDATDIILEYLKDEDLKDFKKKEEIEDVLGTCLSLEEFNELVDLGKKITDYYVM